MSVSLAHLVSFATSYDSFTSLWLATSLLPILCIGIVFLATILLRKLKLPKRFAESRANNNNYPPVVDISTEELFERPREAYEAALQTHGPIVGVWRKGRLEYIVNRDYTKDVFADDRALSFEQGVATILNLRFVMAFKGGRFFRDVDRLVANGLIPKIEGVTNKVFPIFLKHSRELAEHSPRGETDFFVHAHHAIAEAMLTVVMGEKYVNDTHLAIIEALADDIAHVSGIYQNMSFFARTFPRLWIFATWTRIIFGTLIWRYFFVLGPHIWRELRNNEFEPLDKTGKDDSDAPLLHYMGRMYANDTGRIGVLDVLWIACLMLSLVFASVHQTAVVAVWVMYELAARKEYMEPIREELAALASDGAGLTYDALRRAERLDSFIREVLRLKGDTLSTTRQTLQDVPLGGYVIPKGHLVIPLATLSHEACEVHGPNASTFDGFRWVSPGGGVSAATVSLGYFPFGLNRWACPGRVLAVAEIKMIVLSLLGLTTPSLEGGAYRVLDPMNTTSVPPEGTLLLEPLDRAMF